MDVANNIFVSSTVSNLNAQKNSESASISAMKKAEQVQEDMAKGILGDTALNSNVDQESVNALVAETTGKGQNLNLIA
jgi:hypothetical protein